MSAETPDWTVRPSASGYVGMCLDPSCVAVTQEHPFAPDAERAIRRHHEAKHTPYASPGAPS